jgi:hypothetical protein
MIIKIDPRKMIYRQHVQEFCRNPYPKHPYGCPNVGHFRPLTGIANDLKPRVIRECPPTGLLIDQIIDLGRSIYLIYTEYPVGKNAEERRQTHPNLRFPAEWYNVRYWQNRARAMLYAEAEKFLRVNEGTIVDLCPEAHGIFFFPLMRDQAGIKLRWGAWPPVHDVSNIVYQACLGGYPVNHSRLVTLGKLGRTR